MLEKLSTSRDTQSIYYHPPGSEVRALCVLFAVFNQTIESENTWRDEIMWLEEIEILKFEVSDQLHTVNEGILQQKHILRGMNKGLHLHLAPSSLSQTLQSSSCISHRRRFRSFPSVRTGADTSSFD